jgi:NitT/TauT family transport system substrate-binding protein
MTPKTTNQASRLTRRSAIKAGLALAALPLLAACQPSQPQSPAESKAPAPAAPAAPAATSAGPAAPAGQSAPAQKALTKASFAFSTKTIAPLAMNLVIGQQLGYFRDEGLDMEFKAIGTHVAITEGIKNGSLEFGVGSPTFLLPLVAKGDPFPAIQFFEYTYPFKWDWAVLENSPIKEIGDLKGKKLGVASFGTVEQQIGKAMLKQRGIDADSDVTWTAVGEGTPGHVALTRGDIDAMIYFDTGFGGWDAAGLRYRLLPRPNDVPQVGGFFIESTPQFLKDRREHAVGFARGVSKGTVFALENPDAAAKLFLKMFPESGSPGKSEAENVQAIKVSVARRMPLWKAPDPTITKWGFIREQEWKDEVAFAGLTDKITDVKPFFTNELIDDINKFDAEAVKRQARDFK